MKLRDIISPFYAWKRALDAAGNARLHREDIGVLEADAGKYIGFIRMVAERTLT